MEDTEKISLQKVKEEKKRLRDVNYSNMRKAEWLFARKITLKCEGKTTIAPRGLNIKMLNVFVHLVGKSFRANPIHYQINYNTYLNWLFQKFAVLSNFDDDMEIEWSAGKNSLPDHLTFFEAMREGIIPASINVHLTCMIGMASRKRNLLTPSPKSSLNEEIAFACLFMDNVELERLELHTSGRFRKNFLKKCIREYFVAREWNRWEYYDGEMCSEADTMNKLVETVEQDESHPTCELPVNITLSNLLSEHENKNEVVQVEVTSHVPGSSVNLITLTHSAWKEAMMLIEQSMIQHGERSEELVTQELIQANQGIISVLSGLNETLCYLNTFMKKSQPLTPYSEEPSASEISSAEQITTNPSKSIAGDSM